MKGMFFFFFKEEVKYSRDETTPVTTDWELLPYQNISSVSLSPSRRDFLQILLHGESCDSTVLFNVFSVILEKIIVVSNFLHRVQIDLKFSQVTFKLRISY